MIDAPVSVITFLDTFVHAFQGYFGAKLTGVYLHGSLAMGCFNPVSSDIDLLVVVAEKLTLAEKRAIRQVLTGLGEQSPAKGIEMSIVTRQSLQAFQHPSPYELHFPTSGNADVLDAGELTDADLAGHYVITRARGVCLLGEPIDAVFPAIHANAYLDSIVRDAEWSYENMRKGPDEGECAVPVYAVLNFCRVLAYVEQRLVTSKREGGQWGMEHLSATYRPVIQEALNEYAASGAAPPVDCALLKDFADAALAMIRRARADGAG
jgi:predicted nucleotidyltransferase